MSAEGFDAVIPVWTRTLETLFAVYRKSLVPTFEAALQAGRRRIRDAFGSARIRLLDLAEDERPLNLNTPQDYEWWRSAASGPREQEIDHDEHEDGQPH